MPFMAGKALPKGRNIMDLALSGKVAVVTGGSKGIGLAVAKLFLQEGAKIALCARDEEQLHRAAAALGNEERVFYQPIDVTSASQVDAFAKAIAEHFGRLDCWVNNVGASSPRQDSRRYSTDEINWHSRVCFNSVIYGCQSAAPYLKRQGGAIVNIASLAARCGTVGRSTLYGPLKAAVVGLSTTFAGELAAWNIRVNAVLPGFTVTPAVENSIPPEELQANRLRTLLHRAAQPEEIAAPVVFLCSDRASFITGTSLEVSGGNTVVLNTDYSYQQRMEDELGWAETSFPLP